MYHAIVKRITAKNFALVNDGDYEALLRGCTPDIHHRFAGDHALGGERHDRETLRRWFERLGRLCPSLRLTVQDTWVRGLPQHTTIVVRWTSAIPAAAPLPDGSTYANHGVHIFTMRWGKVTAIDANEDSQVVAAYLDGLHQRGVDEAAAAAITS